MLLSAGMQAQKIDFNLSGRSNSSTADGFAYWEVNRAQGAQTATFDGVTITVSAVTGDGFEGNGMNNNWWKDGVNKYDKLVSDGVYPVILDAQNNYTPSTTKNMGIQFVISGLTPGEHSLCAYHNNTDGIMSPSYPKVNVIVNGKLQQEGVEQTIRAQTLNEAGMSYVRFTAEEGKDVTVQYVTAIETGVQYINNYVAVNALIFDQPNPKTQANTPSPAHQDYHANCDAGSVTLSWNGGSAAVKHRVLIGTSPDNLRQVYEGLESSYTTALTGDARWGVNYWRIDEIDIHNNVHTGEIWAFRPRRTAFPGAEGYGRYAIGGRDGIVYHVTSLDDDVNNPQPGTFRYGITKVSGPRTIVFDVCGYITLQGRLTCSDPYVTIAGQTAPGEGITFRGAPFGMNSDGITRFIRVYRGYAGDASGPIEAEQNKGLDGLGMAGSDNAIMDHCSVAWTTDEGFSSRNARGITLQHTLIAEALNAADHPNYPEPGHHHGYAATIGGGASGHGAGSYHHNLLAHNEGRNWSLSGGLDGSGAYDGAHDVFNNVVYNWGNRATDGGTHQLNFVNNYYKMGPATTQTLLLRHQFEGTGKGSQAAYVGGNLRENLNGTKTADAENETYRYELSGGQTLDWNPWNNTPFFNSWATIETAEAAYVNTLSDVGCNQPMMNGHDKRMVTETVSGTYSRKGSKTGMAGLIDREWDAEGYVAIEEIHRAADFDTDQDGMPDWWEALGSAITGGEGIDSEGYTPLERYLNWLAAPHFSIAAGATQTVNLRDFFAGYPETATFTAAAPAPTYGGGSDAPCTATVNGATMTVTAGSGNALATVRVTATAGDISLTRDFNIHIGEGTTGIQQVQTPAKEAAKQNAYSNNRYNIAGQKVSEAYNGIVMQNGKKYVQ